MLCSQPQHVCQRAKQVFKTCRKIEIFNKKNNFQITRLKIAINTNGESFVVYCFAGFSLPNFFATYIVLEKDTNTNARELNPKIPKI